jgi:hypothetical protein
MSERWLRIVFSLTKSRLAISLLERPYVSSCNTSYSRRVSSGKAGSASGATGTTGACSWSRCRRGYPAARPPTKRGENVPISHGTFVPDIGAVQGVDMGVWRAEIERTYAGFRG